MKTLLFNLAHHHLFRSRMVGQLFALTGMLLILPSASGDEHGRRKSRGGHPGNVFDRIGNFIFKVTNDLERSSDPGYSDSSPRHLYRVQPPDRPTLKRDYLSPDEGYSSARPYGTVYSSELATIERRTPIVVPPHTPVAPLPSDLASSKEKNSVTTPDSLTTSSTPVSSPTSSSASVLTTTSPSTVPTATSKSPPTKPDSTSVNSKDKNFPAATRTPRLGRVKSPYAPYNELDVAGLPSGSLAKDPNTGQIFRVP